MARVKLKNSIRTSRLLGKVAVQGALIFQCSHTFVGNNPSNLAVYINLGELRMFAGVISSSIHDFCSILIQPNATVRALVAHSLQNIHHRHLPARPRRKVVGKAVYCAANRDICSPGEKGEMRRRHMPENPQMKSTRE